MLRKALPTDHAIKGSLEGWGSGCSLQGVDPPPRTPCVRYFCKTKEGGRSLLLPYDFGRKQSLSTGHPLLFILLSLPQHTD